MDEVLRARFFKKALQDCVDFAARRSVIGLKYLRYPIHQSDVNYVETNQFLVSHVFPRTSQTLEFQFGSLGSFPLFWLAVVITLVTV